MIRRDLLITGLLMVSGCTVGPEYERPATIANDLDAYSKQSEAQVTTQKTDPNIGWWEHFGDSVTSELVKKALANNADLHVRASRVLQAQALLAQSQGRKGPQVDLNLGSDRSSRSFVLPPPAGRVRTKATTLSPSLSVRYVTDLFGRLRRAEKAAQAEVFANLENFRALQHATIAQVVRARIVIARLEGQLVITRNNTKSWEEAVKIAERRYQRGLTGSLEVHVARENLARSKSEEPDLEIEWHQSLHSLDILLGQAPGTTDGLPKTLKNLPDLSAVPLRLPVALLDRRPDIRAQEHRLHAATARVGVNIAQMLPDITLSGIFGYQSDKGESLFVDSAYIYTLVLDAVQPLFRGGELKAQVSEAEAIVQERAAEYTDTILNALREVEDALINEIKLQERYAYLTVRFTEAQASEKLARDKYLKGIEQLATVLETERSRRQAADALAILHGDLWEARVDLLLALGGDWQTEKYAARPIDALSDPLAQ